MASTDVVAPPPPMREEVVVLGAGIVGLQTATRLLDAGLHVVVVAKHFPGDDLGGMGEGGEYSSPWAGAYIRPNDADPPREQRWTLETLAEWQRCYDEDFSERGGRAEERCGILPTRCRVSYPSTIPTDPIKSWWAPRIAHFKPVSPPPSGASAAAEFSTLVADTSVFPAFLTQRIAAHPNGRLVRAALPLDDGLDSACAAALRVAGIPVEPSTSRTPPLSSGTRFVNALGLAAGRLCNDEAVHPMRGQTVIVRGVAHGCCYLPHLGVRGREAYCVPRASSGVTVLGGTRQPGRWDAVEDVEDTKAILEAARYVCPELLTPFKDVERGVFEVVGVGVGLRPQRRGGARVEKEITGVGVVVHAYGLGGTGFQMSCGVASDVLALLEGDDGPAVAARL